MKLYNLYFDSTIKGDTRTQSALVIAQKVPGTDEYKVKWDFTYDFDDKRCLPMTVKGLSYTDAVREYFSKKRLPTQTIRIMDLREIRL